MEQRHAFNIIDNDFEEAYVHDIARLQQTVWEFKKAVCAFQAQIPSTKIGMADREMSAFLGRMDRLGQRVKD